MNHFPGPRRLAARLLIAAVLPALAACYREASDATASRSGSGRYTGGAVWTVNGLRPGQTFAEARQLLGEPSETREVLGHRFARWSARGDTGASFDKDDRITDILGTSLVAGGKTIIWSSASEADVVQVLGPGEAIKSYRSRSSGVISLGQKQTGTTLVYVNAGVRFEICVAGEAAGHIRAFPQP